MSLEKYCHCLLDPPSSNFLTVPRAGQLPRADADEEENAVPRVPDKMLRRSDKLTVMNHSINIPADICAR